MSIDHLAADKSYAAENESVDSHSAIDSHSGQGGSGPRPDPGVVSPFFCFYFPKHFPKQILNKNKK